MRAFSSGSFVIDQLGCSSLSRCTRTLTTVGGAVGSGAVSGEASVTRMLTELLAFGEGVRARKGVVALLAELRRDIKRSEPITCNHFNYAKFLLKYFALHTSNIDMSKSKIIIFRVSRRFENSVHYKI